MTLQMIVSNFNSPSDFSCYQPEKVADVSKKLQMAQFNGELSRFTHTYPAVGQRAVFCRNGGFYRAAVSVTMGSGLVELTLIDTGEEELSVRTNQLYNLPQRFNVEQLPVCLCRFALRGVVPLIRRVTDLVSMRTENLPDYNQPNNWTPYSVEVCRGALKQTQSHILIAHPQLHGATDGRFVVDAWLPCSPALSLAQLLIDNNCAAPSTASRQAAPVCIADAVSHSAAEKSSPVGACGSGGVAQQSPLKQQIILPSGQRVLVPVSSVSNRSTGGTGSPTSSVGSGRSGGGGGIGVVTKVSNSDVGCGIRQDSVNLRSSLNGGSGDAAGDSDRGSLCKSKEKAAAKPAKSKRSKGSREFRDASDLLDLLRQNPLAAASSLVQPAAAAASQSSLNSTMLSAIQQNHPAQLASSDTDVARRAAIQNYETFYLHDCASPLNAKLLEFLVLIVSNLNPPLQPTLTLAEAGLKTEYADALSTRGVCSLTSGQAYFASAVSRGANTILLAGKNHGKSMACEMAALILTEQRPRNLPSQTYPPCILVCHNWLSATNAYEKIKGDANRLQVTPLVDTDCIPSAEIALAAKGCQLLVAAIKPLVRLINSEVVTPLRNICYLIIDDLDLMLRDSKEDLKQLILAHKLAIMELRGEGKSSHGLPRQVIATAEIWTPELDNFVGASQSPMRSAVEIFESRSAAVVRCRVMHLVQPPNSLIDTLSSLEPGLRVAICLDDENESFAKSLCDRLKNNPAIYAQHIHSDLNVDEINLQISAWKTMRTKSVKVLIMPDSLVNQHLLNDADAIIMLDLPLAGQVFTGRFCLLGAAMRRFDPGMPAGRQPKPPRCFYTWSSELRQPSPKQLNKLYDFLSTCRTFSPQSVPGPELRELLQLPVEVDESSRPLCRRLLAQGRCSRLTCRNLRHFILWERDWPSKHLPTSGTVRFKVLQTLSGNALIIQLLGQSHLLHQMDVAMHFANEKNAQAGKSGPPKVGELCAAYLVSSGYHRAIIDKVHLPTKPSECCTVSLRLVDAGDYVSSYPASDLLVLPESLSLRNRPPMSVEAVILNLAPSSGSGVDGNRDFSWELPSLNYLKTLTDGIELAGRVAFAIGSILFLTDIEHYEVLSASGLCSGFSLSQKMIEAGGARANSQHTAALLRLCQGQLDVRGPEPDRAWLSRRFIYTDSPPELPVAELTDGEPVMIVGSPIRPDQFHVCRDIDWDGLWAMQDEIQSFAGVFKALPAESVRPGLLVLAPYESDVDGELPTLNRASIVSIDSDQPAMCTVNFVDFGDRQRVALEQLRQLPNEYRHLPAHAITCCLAHCSPADPTAGWTDQAITHFADLFFSDSEPPTRRSFFARIIQVTPQHEPQSSAASSSIFRPRYSIQLTSAVIEGQQARLDPAAELARLGFASLHNVYIQNKLRLPTDWQPTGSDGLRELAFRILLDRSDNQLLLLRLKDSAKRIAANINVDDLADARIALLLLLSHLTVEAEVASILDALAELLEGRPDEFAPLLSANSGDADEFLALLVACLDRNQDGGPAHAPAARVLRLALSTSAQLVLAMRSRRDLVALLVRELRGQPSAAAADFCRCCAYLLPSDNDLARFRPLVEPLVQRVRSDSGTADAPDNHLAHAACAINILARHRGHWRALRRADAFDALMKRLLQLLGRAGGPACPPAIDVISIALARLWRDSLVDKATFRAISLDRFCSLVPAGANQRSLRDLQAMLLSEPVVSFDFRPDMQPVLLPQLLLVEGLPTPRDVLYAQTGRRFQIEFGCNCLVQQASNSLSQLVQPYPITIDEQRLLFRTSHCQLWLPLPHPIVPRRTVCRLTSGTIVVALYKRERGYWPKLPGLRKFVPTGDAAEEDQEAELSDADEDASDMASLRSLDRILQLGARHRERRSKRQNSYGLPGELDGDGDSDSRSGSMSDDSDLDMGQRPTNPILDDDANDERAMTRNYLRHCQFGDTAFHFEGKFVEES